VFYCSVIYNFITCPAHSSMAWSINGVGSFLLDKLCSDHKSLCRHEGCLFLKNENMIGYTYGVFNGIDETSLLELIDFSFDSFTFGSMDRPLLLAKRDDIRPSVNVMFNNGRIKSWNFIIRRGENITKLLK